MQRPGRDTLQPGLLCDGPASNTKSLMRLLPACLLFAACTPPDLAPLELPEGCQPLLNGTDCLLPYPSDFFLVPDATMPSGARVALTGAARPRTDRGGIADPGAWRAADGASRLPMPTMFVSAEVSAASLPGYFDDPAASLTAQSNAVLIEASTGRFIPNFVDLDPRATSLDRQALVMHPLIGLEERTRYVVAFQRLKGPDGALVAAPEGFRRLRDDRSHGDPLLEPLQQRFDKDVFPVLKAAGLARADLQLAWDFTTGSDASISADMLRVRELTQAWLSTHVPAVVLTEQQDQPEPDLWRRVRGTLEVPLFLESDQPGAGLHRGADGLIEQNGTMRIPFLGQVPLVLRDAPGPATALGYGHGAFSTRDEALSQNPRDIATRSRAVLFSIDWWGMARADTASTLDAVSNRPARALAFTDRVQQGMANHLVFSAAIAGPFRALPAFQDANGAPLYPPEAARFMGISQGHILAGMLAAVHPGLTRVGLNAGGAGLSHALSRSRPLSDIFLLLDVKDPLQRRAFESTLQPYFDRIDGAFWSRYVLREPLPGNTPWRILMQTGLGDPEVPNLAAFLHARLLGLKQLQPNVPAVYGLEPVAGPTSESVEVLYDLGVDLHEVYGKAQPYAQPNQVHEGTRRIAPALAQLGAFFGQRDEIVNFCSGPCDPD